ncbi:MAG: DNA gyrase inhibitor YacG [Gammaproteobacteria bacterium]|nr:DNA gyrase inhibitor YacG [Gammaproteobacteria bacterium]
MKKLEIACPHCKKKIIWSSENTSRPFCSERCKLIDLGEWADEKYKIPLASDSSENNIPPEDFEDKEE